MADDTLALLRRLEAAGAIPDGYELHQWDGHAMLRYTMTGGLDVRHAVIWWDPADKPSQPIWAAFIVALQRKLATMGVTATLIGAPDLDADGFGVYEPGEPRHAASGLTWIAAGVVSHVVNDTLVGGRLVHHRRWVDGHGDDADGLMRAALEVLETRGGAK